MGDDIGDRHAVKSFYFGRKILKLIPWKCMFLSIEMSIIHCSQHETQHKYTKAAFQPPRSASIREPVKYYLTDFSVIAVGWAE